MHLNRPGQRFLTRWLVSSLGLFIASSFLTKSINYGHSFWVVVVAGLILAAINTVIKPILVLLSLPAVVLSLGIFMVVINGLTVYLASRLYQPLHVANFWVAMFAGIVIGLVNYLVSSILEDL